MDRQTKIKLAGKLRRTQSNAEAIFWREVRGRLLAGFKFRRQVPIDKYIADFVCESIKLIVELDGQQHADAEKADMARTDVLKSKGYHVIRFWNHEVYDNLDGVIAEVLRVLEVASNREI